ncbi:MAG: hypothetical protein JW772_00160 [Candidatus Diapherotrites archaeon]|nr:hypothetical protein [Candidatus Diapherotrites archaeon]
MYRNALVLIENRRTRLIAQGKPVPKIGTTLGLRIGEVSDSLELRRALLQAMLPVDVVNEIKAGFEARWLRNSELAEQHARRAQFEAEAAAEKLRRSQVPKMWRMQPQAKPVKKNPDASGKPAKKTLPQKKAVGKKPVQKKPTEQKQAPRKKIVSKKKQRRRR